MCAGGSPFIMYSYIHHKMQDTIFHNFYTKILFPSYKYNIIIFTSNACFDSSSSLSLFTYKRYKTQYSQIILILLIISGADPPRAGILCSRSCWQSLLLCALPYHWGLCPQIAHWHGSSPQYSTLWNCSTIQPVAIERKVNLSFLSLTQLSLSLSLPISQSLFNTAHKSTNIYVYHTITTWVSATSSIGARPSPMWKRGMESCIWIVWVSLDIDPISTPFRAQWGYLQLWRTILLYAFRVIE